MCGIAGIVRSDHQAIDQTILARMAALLRHRGPDDSGVYVAEPAGLAFRRLAILDLSPAGHQPMTSAACPGCKSGSGGSWLVFNGEVYNYLPLRAELESLGHDFQSQADSETILHAYRQWGPECVGRLHGMFAFALWDESRQTLFAARDRFGIKPFYYHQDASRLLFASEIKALLADPSTPRRPHDRRLYDYLVYGYLDHTAETCFEGILQLPPAHTLVFEPRKGALALRRYWELDPSSQLDGLSDEEAVDRFRLLFVDSVRQHLQSDVAVGTCLSGGLDSSAIVCTVNHLLQTEGVAQDTVGDHQRTFTSSFDDLRFDERRFAALVAEQTRASWFCTFPDPAQLFDLLSTLIWHQDEPFGSTSIVAQWHVMQEARRQGVTVLLDGQGGDETLAGYHTFFSGHWASLMRGGDLTGLWRETQGFRRRHGPIPPKLLSAMVGLALPESWRADLQRRRGRTRPTWLGAGLAAAGYSWWEAGSPFRDPLKRQMHRYLTSEHLPSLLHYEDRNSMAFSIEARVPFLDHRLVEFAFALPATYKLRQGETKWVLRQALADLLPPAIVQRQDKMGFVTPEAIWLRTTLASPVGEVLQSASFRQRPYWQPDEAWRLFQAHADGTADHHLVLWRLLNAELWLRRFCDAAPPELAS